MQQLIRITNDEVFSMSSHALSNAFVGGSTFISSCNETHYLKINTLFLSWWQRKYITKRGFPMVAIFFNKQSMFTSPSFTVV